MSPERSTLVVYEPEPSLSLLLQEQLGGWHVRQVSESADLARTTVQAALIATEGDYGSLAAVLRRAGMIGPIFALGEDVPAPLIGLQKPLRIPALLARLNSPDSSAVDGATIGKWRLDLAQRAIVDDARQVLERLTDKEFSLLYLLLTNAPGTVDRERLQTEIWRYHADADTHTVETHVWRLRQKLEADPANPDLLLTGSDGYFLNRP